MAVTKEMNAQQDRQKALENAMKQITKEFGAGSIMRLGEMGDKLDIEVIPTGSLALDIAVGVGGYPRGRVIEIYGPESSGKTTLALHAIAEAQKMGGVTAFIDAEHALDPVYAHHLGVDTKELLISQPDSGEQALSIAESLVRSGAVDMIVIDSVAALVPKQEIEGDISDASVGLQARLMSKALRKLTGIISKSKTIVIFINQLREKVGVMFGNPETTTGGRIPDEDIYYLMSRGLSEEDAKAMLVRGFAEPISKELPLEYAVEMNRLIDLEFEGAIG